MELCSAPSAGVTEVSEVLLSVALAAHAGQLMQVVCLYNHLSPSSRNSWLEKH